MDLNDYLGIDADLPNSPEPEESERQRQGSQSSDPPQEKPAAGRIIRRRARKACVECHKRKVRCDVLTRGQVCTNCRLDGQPCILRSNDGRRKQQNAQQQQVVREADPEVTSQNSLKNVPGGIITVPGDQNEDHFFSAAEWQFQPRLKLENPAPVVQHSNYDMIFSYYGFLEADTLSHIPPEDFKFLEHKGCFHIPSRPILDDFVREYFLHVHPGLPIIDEREFWELYLGDQEGKRGSNKLSLFVFRAMLFASCSFVPMETIRLIGFQDATEARACFYRRAKFLFDFHATSDNIRIAQGALLLTYFTDDHDSLSNTFWLRTAIQYATTENVHLHYKRSNMTAQERNIRKRLWWCCILRDRILPLGLRRPIQITRHSFDFIQDPLVEDDLAGEFDHSPVYDYDTKRALALILLAQVDLAVVLTDVMSIIYPIKDLDYSSLMGMPTKLQSCRDGLHSWNAHLQDISSLFISSHDSVTLLQGLTQVYYHSALAAMCQYEALAMQASSNTESPRMKELGTELHSAIAQISKITSQLVEIDVARYLPISMVAYIALPIILNSIDLQGTACTTFKNESKRRQLRFYNAAMETCQNRYNGARACARYINRTVATARQGMFPDSPSSDADAVQKLQQKQQATSAALLRRTAADTVDDWLGVFVSQPRQYLRIALTIDISLCQGRFAETDDLPRLVLMADNTLPVCSIPQGLTPGPPPLMELELPAEADSASEEILDPGSDRRDLDYFDFGLEEKSPSPKAALRKDIGDKSPFSNPGLWDGATVENILEDVLATTDDNF